MARARRAAVARPRPLVRARAARGRIVGVRASPVRSSFVALVDRAAAGADASELRSARRGLPRDRRPVAQVLAVIVAWRATTAAWATTNELRLDMTRHVLGLDHEFHRRHTPGELIQRVDGDVTSVSEFLGLVVPKALGAALTIIGMVVVLAVLDWRLAVGLVVYLGATFAVVVRGRHRAVRESSDEMGALGRLYGGIEERLVAVRRPALERRRRARGLAIRRGQLGALASAVRRERAFLTMWWFVQLALAAGLGRGARARGVDDLARPGHDRHGLPPVPVRPADRSAARRPRAASWRRCRRPTVRWSACSTCWRLEPTVLDGGTTSPPPGPLTVGVRRTSRSTTATTSRSCAT